MDISKNFPLLLFINVPNWHFECHEVQGTVLAARERGWIKHHSYSQRTRPVISPLSEQRTAIQPKIITEVWPKHCENSAEDNWIHRSLSNFTLRLLPPQDRKISNNNNILGNKFPSSNPKLTFQWLRAVRKWRCSSSLAVSPRI